MRIPVVKKREYWALNKNSTFAHNRSRNSEIWVSFSSKILRDLLIGLSLASLLKGTGIRSLHELATVSQDKTRCRNLSCVLGWNDIFLASQNQTVCVTGDPGVTFFAFFFS